MGLDCPVGLAAGQPIAQWSLDGQQAGRHQDQEWHQVGKKLVGGPQQQHPARQSTQDGGWYGDPETFFLMFQIVRLGERAAQRAGPERQGVRDVCSYGRKPNRHQNWEGNERSTAGQGVDHAGSEGGEEGEEVVD